MARRLEQSLETASACIGRRVRGNRGNLGRFTQPSLAEASGISMGQVRKSVLGRMGLAPPEGRALVCIVRSAEELTISAANALLKTLEEPPPRTYFVLVTSRPSRLLDTIRSRTLPVRFGPLPEAVIAKLLGERGLDATLAPLAQGSMQQALAVADPDSLAQRASFTEAVMSSLDAPDLATALGFAEGQKQERQDLRALVGHLAQTLALGAVGAAAGSPAEARRLAERYEIVERAGSELERNVGPQLVLEAMVARLRRS